MTSLYTLLTDIDNRLKHALFQLKEEIVQLRSKLASTQYAYPYQGITDAINSAEASVKTLAKNAKDDILQNFDRNIRIMEDACATTKVIIVSRIL